jgi:hypothetical protein
MAKENYVIAAELGCSSAMVNFGFCLDKTDPQRFVWLGKGATSGNSSAFLNEMAEPIHNLNSGAGCANVVFEIGRALHGHVDNEKRAMFGNKYIHESCFSPANQALACYNFQLQSYRKAVDTWTLVGLRNNVVKDIRKMIAKMIWDSREEAKFVEFKL